MVIGRVQRGSLMRLRSLPAFEYVAPKDLNGVCSLVHE
jgi:hypothetical protein